MRLPPQFRRHYAEVDTVDTASASSNRPELTELLGFRPVLAGMRRLKNKKRQSSAPSGSARWRSARGFDDGKEPVRL